ncbi:MAG: hypothetical protein M1813_006541 [Trichoglossum hirsutum]|nr:MAG: hypothetical protein M1813_006541 [Trichoglossum hirsutum]
MYYPTLSSVRFDPPYKGSIDALSRIKQISAQVDASHKKFKDNNTDIEQMFAEAALSDRKLVGRLSMWFIRDKLPKDNETDIRKLYDESDLANRKPLDRLSKRFMSPSNLLITGDDIVKLLGFSALLIGIGWVHSEYKVRRLHLRDWEAGYN